MPAIFLFFFFLVLPAFAVENPCVVGEAVTGVVSSQQGGEWFGLEGDNGRYHPAGLMIPGSVPDDENPVGLAAGTRITFYKGDAKPDRYGRMAVQVFVGDEWLQGRLLRSGRALLFGDGLDSECLSWMREAEQQGEREAAGIWSREDLVFLAQEPGELAQKVGQFVLVLGKISSVGDRARTIYLNFGPNWTQDFTVSVAKQGTGAFKGDVARIVGLKNKTVRVRGILDVRQGPLIRLNDEAQIEVFE